VLDGLDQPALEAACLRYARAKQAARIVDEQGPISTGSTGQLVAHPAIQIERESFTAFLRFAEQYGLTASARTRLGLSEMRRRAMTDELTERIGRTHDYAP
jgi:P27 family predicted phage terminase small subunit